MIAPPMPPNETERLADLRALDLLDTPPEQRFDRIVALAKRVFGVPIAYIALVDDDRQWFKAKTGMCQTLTQTSRDTSFCGHTILQDEPLIVPDALADPRFADNPMVVGEPYVRFYAGHPLRSENGHNVATLCVMDHEPRELDENERAILGNLAALAEHELNLHDLIRTQRELAATQRRLARELDEAARYVRAVLPPPLREGPVRSDYQYIASSRLGGDLLGYQWLDGKREKLAAYLLDVTGHGVGAALLSISVHTTLSRHGLLDADRADPAEVLTALNRAFPMERNDGKFFTIWYGVYDRPKRTLRYATAGHHPAVAFNGAPDPARLGRSNFMIGVVPDATYEADETGIEPRSRLFLFSDGTFEVRDRENRMLTYDGFARVLAEATRNGNGSRVRHAVERVRAYQGGEGFPDDFSLLELEFE